MSYEYELTILMPCLNEAETLETCIKKAQTFLRENNVNGEVLIADNGSTDGSREIAVKAGARVVPIAQRGYGAALIGGCEAAKGEYVIMGLSLIHISEPTRRTPISYAVFCLKKKKKQPPQSHLHY